MFLSSGANSLKPPVGKVTSAGPSAPCLWGESWAATCPHKETGDFDCGVCLLTSVVLCVSGDEVDCVDRQFNRDVAWQVILEENDMYNQSV
jgi:hypothetical protein